MDFNINIDASEINKWINRYGDRAIKEYKQAIKETAIYGLHTMKDHTPYRTNTAKNSWKWAFKNDLLAGVVNDNNYIVSLDEGWNRTTPILPKKAKVLVFQVGNRTAAKSATTTLYKRYKDALKSLRGKEFKSRVKSRYSGKARAEIKAKELAKMATAKSGVVVVKSVKSPAKYKGANFIAPGVNRIETNLNWNVGKAVERLLA